MLNIPVAATLSTVKCSGDEGDQEVTLAFVAPAEDSLFTEETVGEAGHQTYKAARAGHITGPTITPPANMKCSVVISRQGERVATLNQARVKAIAIGTSKDADTPTKAKMTVVHGWKEGELEMLASLLKSDVTVSAEPTSGDLFYVPAKAATVKKRKK